MEVNSVDKSIFFKFTKMLGQHLLGYAWKIPSQLRRASRGIGVQPKQNG